MTLVDECALADARAVVASVGSSESVVGLSPSDYLRRGERCNLGALVVVSKLTMLAPSALPLALLAVVSSISQVFIVHLKDLIESSGGLGLFAALVLEFAKVRVVNRHLHLHLLDGLLRDCFCVTVLMLSRFSLNGKDLPQFFASSRQPAVCQAD